MALVSYKNRALKLFLILIWASTIFLQLVCVKLKGSGISYFYMSSKSSWFLWFLWTLSNFQHNFYTESISWSMNMKILNFSISSRYYIYIAKYTILMFLSHLLPTKQVVVFALLFVLFACFSKITVSWLTVL